jgi:hypothetical protein
MAKAEFYTVKESFSTTIDGHDETYIEGQVVEADDPGLRRAPAHFVPLVIRRTTGHVEQATAAPGEKRASR